MSTRAYLSRNPTAFDIEGHESLPLPGVFNAALNGMQCVVAYLWKQALSSRSPVLSCLGAAFRDRMCTTNFSCFEAATTADKFYSFSDLSKKKLVTA